jgi:hypothetical protein
LVREAEQLNPDGEQRPAASNSIPEARSSAAAIRGTVIAASGHNIALENPAALARAYLDFFAGG